MEQELTTEKTEALRATRFHRQLLLAKARGQLIEKALVKKQLGFLLVGFRQKILSLPHSYRRKMVGLKDTRQASKVLQEMAHGLLNELARFPQEVSEDWLKQGDGEEDSPFRTLENNPSLVGTQAFAQATLISFVGRP